MTDTADIKQQLTDKAAASLLAFEADPTTRNGIAAWHDLFEAHMLAGVAEDDILARAVHMGREVSP